MVRKLALPATAVLAMAAAFAPGVAHATPVLTSEDNPGAAIPPGTPITFTANNSSIPFYLETVFGELECESIMWNFEVTKNTGTEFEGVGQPGSTTSGCSFEGFEGVNFGNVEIVRVLSNTAESETGTGTFELAFEWELPGGASCKFSNKGKPGVFHYKPGSDRWAIPRTNITSSGCGETFLLGEMTLEKEDGTPVVVS